MSFAFKSWILYYKWWALYFKVCTCDRLSHATRPFPPVSNGRQDRGVSKIVGAVVRAGFFCRQNRPTLVAKHSQNNKVNINRTVTSSGSPKCSLSTEFIVFNTKFIMFNAIIISWIHPKQWWISYLKRRNPRSQGLIRVHPVAEIGCSSRRIYRARRR